MDVRKILTCSSLKRYVDLAQERMHTDYPVIVIDRIHHVEPERMKRVIQEELDHQIGDTDTLLVAMGFCGGVWDQVKARVRTVIPRVDDCVSMLLAVDDQYIPNRKETGHLYLYEEKPENFSAMALLHDYQNASTEFQGMDEEFLFHMWFDQYHFLDIIDTGYNLCYEEEYVEKAQENADKIQADLDYVQGSNRILEKLVAGEWDEQFLVAEAGHVIRHADFF
jgi:hypothetical protein